MKLSAVRFPIPFHLVNESTTDEIAGSQINPTTTMLGIATIRMIVIRSAVLRLRLRGPLRAGRPGLPARSGAVGEGTSTDLSDMVTLVSVRRQEAKIDFFWLSMLFTRPSTSFGLPMKVWIA